MLYKVVIFLNVQFHVSYYDSSYLCSSPAPPPRLAMSGIGMLSASSSDLEKSTFNEGCTNLARMAMPPPPVKPKQLRRIQPNALPFSDSSSTTPPSSGTAKECSFGRFPRGALIWSNGKPEQLQPQPGLQGARLDFSPQSILSPHSTNNPTTPLQSGSSENQPQTSSAPLFNATNSDHKIKSRVIEHTIRKVKFLSKNSILKKKPTFSRVFHPEVFEKNFS